MQQQQPRIGCRSNNDPQRLTQSGEWQQSIKDCMSTMGSTFDKFKLECCDDHRDVDHHDNEHMTRLYRNKPVKKGHKSVATTVVAADLRPFFYRLVPM
jgi:hypothetical protein